MGSAMPAWVPMVLAVASWGLVVGAWVLIAVWMRGRRGAGVRWCAKCLYDMTGLPGLRCPECGREAKSEKQVRRRKRRWWALVVALVLFALNYAMWVPGRLAQGEPWKTALVPTWALVLGLPWVAQDRRSPASKDPDVPSSVVTMPFWDAGYDLLMERIDRDELSAWHWEAVGQIGLRSDLRVLLRNSWPLYPTMAIVLEAGINRGEFRGSMVHRIRNLAWIEVDTRKVWPQGSTVIARIRVERWQPYLDKSVRVRVVDEAGREMPQSEPEQLTDRRDLTMINPWRIDRKEETLVRIVPGSSGARGVHRYSVQLVRTDAAGGDVGAPFATRDFEFTIVPERVAEFLTAVPVPAASVITEVSGLQSDWTPMNLRESRIVQYHLELTPSLELEGMNVTVAVCVDVYRGQDKRFTGTTWFPSDRNVRRSAPGRARVDLKDVGLRRLSGEGPWRVVITSHPELALAEFERDRYWAGQGEWVLPAEGEK